MNVRLDNIGVIAPYRAHVNLLKKIVTQDIEINTVDQYQGRDKEIIIYSCAKSLNNPDDIKEVSYLSFTSVYCKLKSTDIIIFFKCRILKY